MSENAPITLRSRFSGLHLRLKPGEQTFNYKTGEYEMKYGKWAKFQRGQCILRAADYLPLYGSREAALADIRQMRNHGIDFTVVDLPVSTPGAPGAPETAPAKRRGRPPKTPPTGTHSDQPPPAQDGTRPE